MEEEKHVIWSDLNLDYNEWMKDLKAEYPDLSEDEYLTLMYEINSYYLEDERSNLNIQLSGPIFVFADLGLWDGRRTGYKIIDSGNISDCLSSECDYNEWFLDGNGDLRCTAVHHDGTNHYLYRAVREGIPDWKVEMLQDKLYDGRATQADISKITRRLGDEISAVYGYDIPEADGKERLEMEKIDANAEEFKEIDIEKNQEPEHFQSGKDLAEFLKDAFPITEKEGDTLIGYMDGHGYLLGHMDGKMFRGDLTCEQDKVDWEPYTIDDAVNAAADWNYDLLQEEEGKALNPAGADYKDEKKYLDSLREDEAILDGMFDRTKYGKEIDTLADTLSGELIEDVSREGGIDAAVKKMAGQIKKGMDLLPGISPALKKDRGRVR